MSAHSATLNSRNIHFTEASHHLLLLSSALRRARDSPLVHPNKGCRYKLRLDEKSEPGRSSHATKKLVALPREVRSPSARKSIRFCNALSICVGRCKREREGELYDKPLYPRERVRLILSRGRALDPLSARKVRARLTRARVCASRGQPSVCIVLECRGACANRERESLTL